MSQQEIITAAGEVAFVEAKLQLWSATTLIKQALGVGEGLVNFNKETVIGICYDKFPIFKAFVDEGDRNGALDWALGGYWDALGKASARGTEVHKVAEKYALGLVPDIPEGMEPYVTQYRCFLEDFQPEFLMAEAPVYNLTYLYAGTLDGIAKIQGVTTLIDIKTTEHGPDAVTRKGKPKRRPPFAEVALQLSLYRYAELVGLLADRVETHRGRYYSFDPASQTEPMPQVEAAVCVVVSPFDYKVVPVDTSERIWTVARHMMKVAEFQVVTSNLVFGPELTPTLLDEAGWEQARLDTRDDEKGAF
jgi:hypothetical protein